MAPDNLVYSVIGASLLWVGWFGFNAGSAVAANGIAGMAMAVTQIATAAAALAWMCAEWVKAGKPSVLGIISGAVAGLVAITPASGFVGPGGALFIGIAAGILCYLAATSMKHAFGYDDSLDVFGIHGVGGIVGAILTGVFAVEAIGGRAGVLEGNLGQLMPQIYAVLATVLWSGAVSLIILKVIDATIGLRVSRTSSATVWTCSCTVKRYNSAYGEPGAAAAMAAPGNLVRCSNLTQSSLALRHDMAIFGLPSCRGSARATLSPAPCDPARPALRRARARADGRGRAP